LYEKLIAYWSSLKKQPAISILVQMGKILHHREYYFCKLIAPKIFSLGSQPMKDCAALVALLDELLFSPAVSLDQLVQHRKAFTKAYAALFSLHKYSCDQFWNQSELQRFLSNNYEKQSCTTAGLIGRPVLGAVVRGNKVFRQQQET
jgi:hypothetical protein